MPTDTKRTYGLHLYSPLGADYRVEVERETIRTYENGDTARVAQTTVQQKMSALAARPLPGAPLTLATYADLAAAIAACAAALADEAAAAAAAEASRLAAAKAAQAAAALAGTVAAPVP